MKNYNTQTAIEKLTSKTSCSVSSDSRAISITHKQSDLGIGSWARIDFLINYCGFRIFWEPKPEDTVSNFYLMLP